MKLFEKVEEYFKEPKREIEDQIDYLIQKVRREIQDGSRDGNSGLMSLIYTLVSNSNYMKFSMSLNYSINLVCPFRFITETFFIGSNRDRLMNSNSIKSGATNG